MILVCGESLVDLVPARCGPELGYVARPGGSPLNVAVGLARLEVPTGFLTRLSRDRFGRMLRARLADEGVDLGLVATGDELTALAVVHLVDGSEPEFSFHGEGAADTRLGIGDLPAELPPSVAVLHLGSISLVRESGATAYEALMERERGRRLLSLDPNVRPSLIPDRERYLDRLARWVACSDVVKVSAADLRWLAPDRQPKDVARDWLAAGPALVVVTRGSAGATAYLSDREVSVPLSERVVVADTVGAGDAFTAGLLTWVHDTVGAGRTALARLDDAALADGLTFANLVAARTCERVGADPPRWAELGPAGANGGRGGATGGRGGATGGRGGPAGGRGGAAPSRGPASG